MISFSLLHARRRSLDATFEEVRGKLRPPPAHGWIREIRTVLGMRMYQLAKRLNMDRSAVSKLEESEKRGTITINSLLKVAEALDCELHYILIPRQSLEKCVMEQARKVEQRRREQIATTMTLEEQPTTPSSPIQESLEAALLVINDDKSLWDED